MTLAEFHSKPLATKADAVATIKDSTFDEVCAYIADGDDSRVSTLLAGLWASQGAVTKEQMLKAAVCALFPNKGYMRRTTSSSGVMLAKAAGCQHELQRIVKERWVSMSERGCNELVLALSDTKDLAGWMPLLSVLFGLNTSNDIRTQLVRVVNNIVRATGSPEAHKCLDDFLRQMPVAKEAYSNRDNFQFVETLKAAVSRL